MRDKHEELRREIEQHTQEFLAKGGVIKVDTRDPIPPNHKANLRYLTGNPATGFHGGAHE